MTNRSRPPAGDPAPGLRGLYLSWSWDLPVGGTIVLTLTAAVLGARLPAPRHRVLARLVR